MKITALRAQEILDSRSFPTLQITLTLDNGSRIVSSVPAGASTGSTEVFELRDNNPSRFNGKGVLKAVENVNTTIANLLIGQEVDDQAKIDNILIEADGTPSKARLGGNAVTGVSMAVCRAGALAHQLELYEYFGKLSNNQYFTLPQPQIVVMEGGQHGHWAMDLQEIMLVPFQFRFSTIEEALQATGTVFHTLSEILISRNHDTGIGYAGVYAPSTLRSNEEAIEMVASAVGRAGYTLGEDFAVAIDVAASEFFRDNSYQLRSESNRQVSLEEWQNQLVTWVDRYQLWSIEDAHQQEAWDAWADLVEKVGDRCQIVGDDLLTTNPSRISMAIEKKAVTAATIKINQIGTITETIESVTKCQDAGLTSIISHRGGETDDDMIADMAAGTTATECKFGSPDHDERVLKYQRLLQIEQKLSEQSISNEF